MDELLLQKDMSDSERMMFQSEMAKIRKNKTTALLLTFFLGGLGGHKYYMGQLVAGVLYSLFCWTFIPGIIAFVELFLISGQVDRYNAEQAEQIATKVRLLGRPSQAA